MAVVGAILAGFYLVAVAAAMVAFGEGILAIAIVGSILLIGVSSTRSASGPRYIASILPENPYLQIHQFVEQVCRDKDMEKPSLKIADIGVPHAFAVGRHGNSTVVISWELIQLLDHDEFESGIHR